jgi:hypothetical protein
MALLVSAFTGCGSSRTTTVVQPVIATASQATASTPTAPPPTTTAPTSSYPLVQFTTTTRSPHGIWPFTAQLASITENPNGFSGAGEPPQDTYLMVQVDVTSKITGRLVPAPHLTITCHAPDEHGWEPGPDPATGYDEGSQAPDPSGSNVALGDGQPHPWDVEWQVPIGTSTTDVTCALRSDPNSSYLDRLVPRVKVEGTERLN